MKKYITKKNIIRVVLLVLVIVIITTLSIQKSNAKDETVKAKQEVESVEREMDAQDVRVRDCVEVMDASITANAYYILSDMTLRNALLKAIEGDASTLNADIRTANGHSETAQDESDKYTLAQVNMCRDGE